MPIILYPESRENILLIGNASELNHCAAIINSLIESFLLQEGEIEIWAYTRNRMYRTYYEAVWSQYEPISDIEDVCKRIFDLKRQIIQQKESKRIIVLMGFERHYADFELYDGMSKAVVSNGSSLSQIAGLTEVKDEEPSLFEFLSDSLDENLFDNLDVGDEKSDREDSVIEIEEYEMGAYNAKNDFEFVLQQGSRLGYHFVLVSNEVINLKQNRIDFNYFRHKLAFNLTRDDSWDVFGTKIATGLPNHVCQYSDGLLQYSFHPYMHKEISWDGWYVDDDGVAKNEF